MKTSTARLNFGPLCINKGIRMGKSSKDLKNYAEQINGLLLIKATRSGSAESTDALARRIFPGLDEMAYAMICAEVEQLFDGSFAYVAERSESQELLAEVKDAFPAVYECVAQALIERAKNLLNQ